MKKIFFLILPVAALVAFTFKASVDPLPIGSSLPKADVKMKNIGSDEVSFKEAMQKKGLLVIFTCNTCPVVKKYQTRLNEVCKYALGNGVGVIMINSNEAYRDNGDSYDDMKEYAKASGFDWNYVVDNKSTMANEFGATRTPENFLFNADGKLVYHGAVDDNQNGGDAVTRKHLRIAIDELLAGKEISMKNTRSVGCNIKRVE
jgi:thiol-disulfide isomerase/thioredoxin